MFASLWWQVALTQRAASAAFFDGSPELLESLDKSVRARLFSPVTDPFWAYIDRLLGEQPAAALRDLLCDGQELIADYPTDREVRQHTASNRPPPRHRPSPPSPL